MKTRIFTLLFAVMAGMVTMNAEIYYGTCGANGDGSNILWTFNIETGALVLKGSGKMADYSDHTSVPWYEYRLFIESVELKSGITNIGVNAFSECKNLTSVILPEGLLSIGEAAFVMCVNLTEISLPNSLTTIERGAFNYCNSLTSMYIPANVSSIAPDAFWVNVVYTEEWTILPFIKTNFTHIDVDPANMYFASKDGVLYNKQMTKLIVYPAGKEGKLIVPNGVQEIGHLAFYGNMSLTEIEIPLSVTTIGEWAFGYCANLKSLTLPSSIKEIGAYAIGGLIYLPAVTCEAVNPPAMLHSELYGDSGLGFGNMSDEHNNPISQILYVPANSVEAYKAAEGWKDIPNILPISAIAAAVADIHAEPTSNSVVIEWPKDENAETYTIVIKKGDKIVCTLEFDAEGQLLTIAFAAPARDGKGHQTPAALQTTSGWQYTISGLEANTEYTYIVIARKSDNSVAYEQSVPFKTKDVATGLDSIEQEPRTNSQKLIKDNHILILRGEHVYDAQGKRVK